MSLSLSFQRLELPLRVRLKQASKDHRCTSSIWVEARDASGLLALCLLWCIHADAHSGLSGNFQGNTGVCQHAAQEAPKKILSGVAFDTGQLFAILYKNKCWRERDTA